MLTKNSPVVLGYNLMNTEKTEQKTDNKCLTLFFEEDRPELEDMLVDLLEVEGCATLIPW